MTHRLTNAAHSEEEAGQNLTSFCIDKEHPWHNRRVPAELCTQTRSTFSAHVTVGLMNRQGKSINRMKNTK